MDQLEAFIFTLPIKYYAITGMVTHKKPSTEF